MSLNFEQHDHAAASYASGGDSHTTDERVGRAPDFLTDGLLPAFQAAASAAGGALLAGALAGLVAQRPEAGGLLALSAGAAVAARVYVRGDWREALSAGIAAAAGVGAWCAVLAGGLTRGVLYSTLAAGGAAGFCAGLWSSLSWLRYESGVVLRREERRGAAVTSQAEAARDTRLRVEVVTHQGANTREEYLDLPGLTAQTLRAALDAPLSRRGIAAAAGVSADDATRIIEELVGRGFASRGAGNQPAQLTRGGLALRRVLAAE